MKKNIYMLLISLCIIGGMVFYKTVWLSPYISPAVFCQKNTLFYLNHKDLGLIFNVFKKKPLAQALESIDFIEIALDIGTPIEIVEKMRQSKEILQETSTQLFLEELLSEEFTIAVQPGKGAIGPGQFLKQNILLISSPKHSSTLLELLSSTFAKRFKINSAQYGKYIIHRIQVGDDLTVSFVRVGSLVLIALNERSLRDGLDRYDDNRENLTDNILFKKLKNQYEEAQLFSFFSIEKLQEKLRETFDFGDKPKNGPSFVLDSWSGLTHGAYGTWYKKLSKEDVLIFHLDRDKLNEHTSKFLNIKAENDSRIYQVPTDVLLYYWTNTFDLPTLWDIYVVELKKGNENFDNIEETITNLTGTTINELIALAGNRISIMVKKPSAVDFLPIPNFTLVFDLKDVNKACTVLKKILTRNEIPHNRLTYRETDYIFWGEEVQSGLQPVYAFQGDSIYISSSVRMLKDILDTIISGDGLTTSENFKQSSNNLLLKNNSVVYIQLESLLDVSKELVSWSGTMLAIQNRDAAYKTKIVIDRLIQPVLDGLKMYSTIATRSYIEKETIIIESKTTFAH